jgi:hypothetical protein
MPNRTAKFLPIIIASLFAGFPLAASIGATPSAAADECLAGPKGQTPEGRHWYYRIEHPSNRHCWYLRAEGDAPAQTAAANPPAAAKPVAPKPDETMPGSVANARAELSSQAPVDQDSAVNDGQVPAAADPASIGSTASATVADPNMLRSVVASRWPEQLSANSPAVPPPAQVSPPADVQADATPAAPPAVVPLAAADASRPKQSGSGLILLTVVAGALSVAGLVASAVFRFGGKRLRISDDMRGGGPPIWDLEHNGRPRSLPFPAAASERPNIGIPRELQMADDPDDRDRIAQMLARLARSAQN